MTEMTMTGGQALVAALAAHGVDTVFGIPGTHNLEIYRHLGAHGIRHVGTRHEQGAGYMADGYARTTGRPGVALVTSGPAVLNAATALAQAWSDSVPVLLVSPEMPLRHPALGNGFLHESRDQRAALAAVSAASMSVTSVEEIPTAMSQAFALMLSGRPRPVHLAVPLDVLAETADVEVPAPVRLPAITADPAAVDEAVDRLAAASRPVMLAGGGCKGAAGELQRLAELLGAAVVTTINGKGVMAEDHALSVGAGVHLPAIRAMVEQADVVLAVGTELAPADHWYGPLPLAGKLIRIDIDPVGIVTNAWPDVAVVGDAATVLSSLADALTDRDRRAAGDAHTVAAGWRELKDGDARAEGAEWVGLIDELTGAVPRDVIVGADNAMACYYGAIAGLPTNTAASFLYPTGFGTLGYGLPAAIGAKVANPDRPVLAMLGDGGVMFTVQELAVAAELGLPLPVLIVDNSGYGEIRNEMLDRDDPVHAVTFGGTDFAALGRAMGCHAVTLDSPDGLGAVVEAAFTADRPTVIHLIMAGPQTSPMSDRTNEGETA